MSIETVLNRNFKFFRLEFQIVSSKTVKHESSSMTSSIVMVELML